MSSNFDINNNPFSSPSPRSNESYSSFRPDNEPFDDIFWVNRFNIYGIDNLRLWSQLFDNALYNNDNVNLPSQNIEPPNLNIPIEAMATIATTQNPANLEVKKKFIGRRRKNKIYGYEAVHTKFEKKDILTKIKKASYNNFLRLVNKNLKDSEDEELKKRKIKLRKIDNAVIGVCSKEDNLNLIKMKMKDILSNPLSNNYKRIDKNYNKNEIDFIFGRKDEKLISSLNKSFEDVIRIYANDLVDEDFDGFITIEDEIKDYLKDKPDLELEEVKYIKTYKEFAKNYKGAYNDIEKRCSRKKKIN